MTRKGICWGKERPWFQGGPRNFVLGEWWKLMLNFQQTPWPCVLWKQLEVRVAQALSFSHWWNTDTPLTVYTSPLTTPPNIRPINLKQVWGGCWTLYTDVMVNCNSLRRNSQWGVVKIRLAYGHLCERFPYWVVWGDPSWMWMHHFMGWAALWNLG